MIFYARAENTYQSIARNVYRSDTYAQAPALYNRDHLLATPAAKEHPETILAGQRVYEPPVRILKRVMARSSPIRPMRPARVSPPASRPGSPRPPVQPPRFFPRNAIVFAVEAKCS